LAVDLRFAVDFRFAVDRLAVDLRAVLFFFAPPDLRAVVLRAVVLRAAVFFFAAAFFRVPDFFADDFFADDFFRPPELRVDPERELERELERVVAGMAIVRSSSAPSVVSPIADSPHVSSASAGGSLHEPVLGVSDASPVPLQSSSVMYDLLSRIARARFPTTLLFNVQRGQHESSRTLLKRKTCASHVFGATRTRPVSV
jgi:hypothetical protein